MGNDHQCTFYILYTSVLDGRISTFRIQKSPTNMDVEIVVFLVIALAQNAVSGISMCKGPFRPPELISATEEPVYNYRNELQRLKVKLEVESANPLILRWTTYGRVYEQGLEATPENADFRSSVHEEDNNQVFMMDIKTKEGVNNITDTILRDIHVTLDVNYSCNTVSYDLSWNILREMTHAQSKLVVMTGIPQGRYLTADGDEGAFNITLGFTYGTSRKPPRVSTTCMQYLARKNGNLTTPDMRGPSAFSDYQSWENENRDLGETDTTCEVDFPKDLDSLHVALFSRVRVVNENDVMAHDVVIINIIFELRRNGVTKPAILLRVSSERNPYWVDGILTVASKGDNVQMDCLADAEMKPHVALAKVRADGRYEVLPRVISSLGNSYQSVAFARFKTRNPDLSTTDEYICSAGTGSTVTSQRFQVLRYRAVTIDGERDGYVFMNTTTGGQYNFTCAAKGFPQPKIRFYWTPGYRHMPGDAKYYLQANGDNEIKDTDYIKTTVNIEGDTTIGRLTLVDFKQIIDGQPADFWSRFYQHTIICYAYNDFYTTSKKLGDYDFRPT